jgi:hypothetical protein
LAFFDSSSRGSQFWRFTDVLRENLPSLTRKVGEIVEAGRPRMTRM